MATKTRARRGAVGTAHRSQGARPAGSRLDVAGTRAELVLQLQREVGNQAVARLLQLDAVVSPAEGAEEAHAEAAEHGVRSPRPAPSAAAGRRSELAPSEGAAISGAPGVQVHRGPEAAAMAEALGAEAFTHGRDVFLGAGHDPSTAAGRRLVRHEAAHATGPGASAGRIHLKRSKKHLDFLRFKRKETHITRMVAGMALSKVGLKGAAARVDGDVDHYGHWWVELGHLADPRDKSSWTPVESYGWWPERSVSIAETLKIDRVEGKVNRGEGDKDPHHGESGDEEFHPVLEVDDAAPYAQVRDQVADSTRAFANGFSGSWNWRLGWGKNCHTFQDRLKKHLGVHHQKASGWLTGDGVAEKVIPPRTFDDVLATFGAHLRGVGFGNIDAYVRLIAGQVDAADLAALSADQRVALLRIINHGIDIEFSRATANDLNQALSGALGPAAAVFTLADEQAAKPDVQAAKPDVQATPPV